MSGVVVREAWPDELGAAGRPVGAADVAAHILDTDDGGYLELAL